MDPALLDPAVHLVTVDVATGTGTDAGEYTLSVVFSDHHASVYTGAWLAQHVYARDVATSSVDVISALRPTRLSDITVQYDTATPKQYRDIIRTYGCIVVEKAPNTPEDSIRIVKERLGANIIPTHFGIVEGETGSERETGSGAGG